MDVHRVSIVAIRIKTKQEEMTHKNLEIYFGPPGTGKTDKLLTIIKSLLAEGVKPNKIAFLTFSKKAAEEAKHRASEDLSLDPEDLVWFRTIHSMVFRLLGLSRTQVVKHSDFKDMEKLMGIEFQGNSAIDEDGIVKGAALGDKLVFLENIGRATGRGYERAWEDHDHGCGIDANRGVSLEELAMFSKSYRIFKQSREIVDYTDMLEKFILSGVSPEFEAVLIDEGQDLSNLAWDVVDKICDKANRVYVAGDDDQGVYFWAGAEVDRFISLVGRTTILDQSHRMPMSVHELSQSVIKRIKGRQDKQFKPRNVQGQVSYVQSIDDIDMGKGEWLLLARHVYQLGKYEKICRDNGWTYSVKGRTFANSEALKAIVEWEKIRKGEDSTILSAQAVYRMMSSGVSESGKALLMSENPESHCSMQDLKNRFGLVNDLVWYESFDLMSFEEKQFYRTARRQGEKLIGDPRIKISTVHGAKGGQAPNVVFMPDISEMTYAAMQRDPDNETRVAYVGLTRAQENLFIPQPKTNLFFEV